VAASQATGEAEASTPGEEKQAEPEKVDAYEVIDRVRAAALKKRTATLSMTSGTSNTAEGVVRYGKPLDMALTMENSGQSMKMVMLGNVFYLNMGQPINGKNWLRMDSKSTDPMAKSMMSLMRTMQTQSNLPQAPAALKGVPATSAPGEEIDGVPTTAYTVKLNSKQLASTLTGESRKMLGTAMAGATSSTTYYVDADWLPLRLDVATTVKGKTSSSKIEYGKWGESVTIKAPAASDTTTRMLG
jgi:hypothetical protein